MILLIAIIFSLVCVIATHKLVAMMVNVSLSKMYSFYFSDQFSFGYLLYMSAIMYTVYILLAGAAYRYWVQ